MDTQDREEITVETTVNAPVEKVWDYFSLPKHIMQWNNASDDWFTPRSENDFKEGGKFVNRMEAKDGSMGFDFTGTYQKIVQNEYIEYTITDGRSVKIAFEPQGEGTKMSETFEAETTNSVDIQKKGWQSILDNFKKYTESN
ncbi:MAG: SRPBCC family protein [Bacteroidota bacterium]|nr:SRPBCC family protein [Bacteroidota bacterium]